MQVCAAAHVPSAGFDVTNADWIIDGQDMLAAIRTAYDGANSYHNSNQITFKRIVNYRQFLPPSTGPTEF